MARNPSLPTNIIPPFRSRRTLADCVAENMKLAGRLSHWHRFAAVCALSDTSTQLSTDVKQSFKTMLSNVNLKSRGSDKISGFVAFSAAHAVMVLTGNERNFGVFFGELSKRWAGFFANSRVVFYQTNVNYRFSEHLQYLDYDSESQRTTQLHSVDDPNYQIQSMAKCLKKVLSSIQKNEVTSNRPQNEQTHPAPKDIESLLPKSAAIEVILRNDLLMTLEDFVRTFNLTSSFEPYDERVWPMPNNVSPDFVFTNEKYDVNMIFGKD